MLDREAAPLRARALEAIREKIVNNVYPPASRIKERDLCADFGVSRTVVREVLRQLETQRLVRIVPNIGPIVAELTLDDVRALYEVRVMLEATAGRLAAINATPGQLAALTEAYDRITLGTSLPLKSLLDLKNEFYKRLFEASGNFIMAEIFDNIQARLSQLRRLTLSADGRREQMVAELGVIVAAIRVGNADAAYAACEVHVRSAERTAMAGFDSLSADGAGRGA